MWASFLRRGRVRVQPVVYLCRYLQAQ